ncbi:MAG: hypothetical protein HY646_18940 [Acidobacteria bacterium]|nr:hypothetical protein [Acidobacteriota bacterium]
MDRHIIPALILALTITSASFSQTIPGRWEKVDRLQPSTTVVITLRSGQAVAGTFRNATAEAVTMVADSGSEISFLKNDIQKVVKPRGNDRLRNGVLIGTGVGFASGFIALFAFDRAVTESGYRFDGEAVALYTQAGLIGAGIGALAGLLTDAAIKGDEVLYQARR